MDQNYAAVNPVQKLFSYCTDCHPQPGSAAELEAFAAIQLGLSNQFELFFPDNLASKTIVVVPSLSLDQEVLAKVKGSLHYEERLLCLLMLLRMPRANVVYVSSMPIDPVIIDYYLHLLPGITGYHAWQRLTLIPCYDTSPIPLTKKILQRPRLMERIRQAIPPGNVAHIACFNSTPLERTLSVHLGIPIYGCDPSLVYLGTKSGSRRTFMKAGVPVPTGAENLTGYDDIVHALVALKDMHPEMRKAVVKLNDGFSGEGNAVMKYPENLCGRELEDWLQENLLEILKPVSPDVSIDMFLEKFILMEGIVEAYVDGEEKTSPSVQCRINPMGDVDIISTHDQVLSGEDGQVFEGAHFPANEEYRTEIAQMTRCIAEVLKQEGVIGRFGVDFISVKENNVWVHQAIEINLRKGGTTHPFLMLQFLTNGHYDEATGIFETPNMQQLYYFASDNVQNDAYKGLTPKDLIDIAMFHGLHFDGATQKGVMFHMIGALSQYGKMGMVCIGTSREEAYSLYLKTIAVLDAETAD
ncbi:MAG: peptide ligase PGM1-related protein [Ferruginibacter sp.]